MGMRQKTEWVSPTLLVQTLLLPKPCCSAATQKRNLARRMDEIIGSGPQELTYTELLKQRAFLLII